MSSSETGVVIAGGGLAAQRCAETLRRLGYEGRVRIVCAEPHRPYDRPPLSKEVLDEGQAEDAISFRSHEWLDERSIEVLEGATASAFDAAAHRLELADGFLLGYEQLVIATGSRPRMLEPFAHFGNVSVLRTIEDSLQLRGLLERGAHLLIVGAGFIGQEVAVAARKRGLAVTVVEAAPLPMHGLLGSEIGGWFAALHREEGVDLLLGQTAAEIHGGDRVEAVTLDDGRRIECDHVLVGVGVAPETGWTGIETGGVPVDAGGRSEWPDVYAAGDAAAFYDPFLGRHALSGHWESAGRQGAAVAHSITGSEAPRPALSSFWSDQYGMRIQYLGHAALADTVEIDGDTATRDFVALYTRAGELVAALIVGRPRALGELRERLAYIAEA
ncbi:MAG TPA: FAD/NAD(P)-binding oxidoreductase [Solirubrobacteraceae bacterium]|nr:FAD/NAD(P)-binding oxidoreductase [Solirubrobacteraceae bacterium]